MHALTFRLRRRWTRRRRRRVRSLAAAYRANRNNGNALHYTYEIVQRSVDALPAFRPASFGGLVPERYLENAAAYTRQRLLAHGLITNLLPAALLALNGTDNRVDITVAAPREVRQSLRESGVPVAGLPSLLAWGWYQIRMLLTAPAVALRLLYQAGKAPLPDDRPFIALVNMPPDTAPAAHSAKQELNTIGAWVRDRYAKDRPAPRLWLQNRGNVRDDAAGFVETTALFPALPAIAMVRFLLHAAWIVLVAACRTGLGSWQAALAARGAVELAYAQKLPDPRTAQAHVFCNSDFICRPLWSYEMAARGRPSILYFYSANCFPVEFIGRKTMPPLPGYPSMTWDRYLVWHTPHKKLLEDFGVAKDRIEIAGTLPWTDIPKALPPLPLPVISAFDIQPTKAAQLASMGLVIHYYCFETSKAFFDTLIDLAEAHGFTLAIKNKRAFHATIDRRYANLIGRLENHPNVVLVDPRISAKRLVTASSAVVSMPFTSVSHIATANGVPTTYFDPTGGVVPVQPAAAGVRVLQDTDALEQWLANVLAGSPGQKADRPHTASRPLQADCSLPKKFLD